MPRSLLTCVLTLTLTLVTAPPLSATVLLPAHFDEMVRASQLIVHARVLEVRGDLVGSRRAIESLVTVAVITSMKGEVGRDLAFRVPGGRVGRYRRVFVGAPTFSPGDEVVLFLTARGPAVAMPFGLSQGVYRVSRTTGIARVMPAAAVEGVAGTLRGDPARRSLPLDEFARQVQRRLEVAR